jgi:PilZ domain-containing protein
MSLPQDDRRLHPRLPIRFPLYVALQGELYQKMVTVEAVDVSKGGLAFETKTPLPKDAKTTVMVGKLDGLPGSAHIEARVVHSKAVPGTDSFQVGVQFVRFVDITPEELIARVTTPE